MQLRSLDEDDPDFDSIDVVLEYGAPIAVDPAQPTPTLWLRIGAERIELPAYTGGSGGRQLLFRYLLPKPFGSPGSVRVIEHSLGALAGTIRYAGSEGRSRPRDRSTGRLGAAPSMRSRARRRRSWRCLRRGLGAASAGAAVQPVPGARMPGRRPE